MEEYNQLIASYLLDGIERGVIKSTPQPTMFGGKRMRKFVLPGSTEFDYPGTLSVGSLDGTGSDTIGGSFWKDFGHGFKTGFTGTAKALAPIAVPIAKELLLAKMRGAGECSDDDMEGGMLVGADGHGIYHPPHMMAEAGLSRADGREMGSEGGYFTIGSRQFGKKHGGSMLGGEKDEVREWMKTIGSVINPALLVGLGRPGADGHGVRTTGGASLLGADGHGVRQMVPPAYMGGASAAEKAVGAMNPLLWGYDLGKNVIAPAMMKVTGRGRMVKGSPEAKAYMAQLRAKKMSGGAYVKTGKSKPAGYIRRLVAEQTKAPPFDIDAVGEPSDNLKIYAKSNKVRKSRAPTGKSVGRPQKYATADEKYQAKLLSNKLKRQERALAKKMGGAMIMNHPGEFHSSIYPQALESYKHQMSVGGSFLGDMGKAFKPVAKDVFVPLAKEVATEYIRGKVRGGKKSSFLSGLAKAVTPVAKDVFIPLAKEMATEAIRSKIRGGKKSSFLGDMGKAFAPVAKDVFIPLAKEMATEAIRSKMRGGKGNDFIKGVAKVVSPVAKVVGKEIVIPLAKEAIKNKMKGGARSARNEIVKKVMAQMGLSLPMASKYVKENGLY
jgi:hypothetical protein